MSAEPVPIVGRLAELETAIERGIATFVEVGEALLEIRESRLYRESHATFEAYCRERWGWQRAHAYRLMDGAKVARIVSPMGDVPTERQARELVPLRDMNPVELRQFYGTVQTQAEREGKPLTAAVVRTAVRDHIRSMAAESEAEIQEATAHWTSEQRAAVTPDRMRSEGELMRLAEDLAALPEPIAFVRDHGDMPWRVIAQAEQAHTWLTDFLDEWRHTHAR